MRGSMVSGAQDDQSQHRKKPDERTDKQPPDDLWRMAVGLAQVSSLYFSHNGNEGAAQIAQALALVFQMMRPNL